MISIMQIEIDPTNETEVRKLARDHFEIVKRIFAGELPPERNPHEYVLNEYMNSLPEDVRNVFYNYYATESDKCAAELNFAKTELAPKSVARKRRNPRHSGILLLLLFIAAVPIIALKNPISNTFKWIFFGITLPTLTWITYMGIVETVTGAPYYEFMRTHRVLDNFLGTSSFLLLGACLLGAVSITIWLLGA